MYLNSIGLPLQRHRDFGSIELVNEEKPNE